MCDRMCDTDYRGSNLMNRTSPRLQQQRPPYDAAKGDSVALGFESAMEKARAAAAITGERVIVTVANHSTGMFPRSWGLPLRVQVRR